MHLANDVYESNENTKNERTKIMRISTRERERARERLMG